MEIFPPKKIKIAPSKGRGRGIFATENIQKGEVIECCPIVFIAESEVKFFENNKTTLNFYYLQQPEINKNCLMLGYGSLYNHSKNFNAEICYETESSENFLTFEAVRDIEAGEEIFYDYQFDNDKEAFIKLD